MNTGRTGDDTRPGAGDLLTKLGHRSRGSGLDASRAHTAEVGHRPPAAGVLRWRALLAVGLTLAVVLLSLLARDVTAARWSQAALTILVACCAWPVARPVWASLRRLRPNPDTPTLLGACLAWVHSVIELVRGEPDTWFGTAAVVTALLIVVRWVEARTLEQAGQEATQPPMTQRLRPWFAPVVALAASLALAGWLVKGHSLGTALGVAVAVLAVPSFPALALAATAAGAAAHRVAPRRGAIAGGPGVLSAAAAIDTLVINRTGVLTTGEVALKKIAVTGRLSKKAALTAAAAVEQGSDHPIARAIVAGAALARIDLPRIDDFEANPGEGASARIKDTEVTIGKAALFEHVDETLRVHADRTPGRTVYVGWDGRARAALTVDGTVRDTSKPAVARLKRLGLAPYLLTDGGEAHALSVAQAVGIDPGKARSRAQPGGSDLVADLQRQGRRVAVLGRPRPGLLFDGDDLDAAADTVELAQRTRSLIRQNLGWAIGYNAVALAAAALGVVHPAVAGVLAALAIVPPLANARRLDH